MDSAPGSRIYDLAKEIYPLNRSLTGEGVRQTLAVLNAHLEQANLCFTLHEIPSGTAVFDWVIPREWEIREAYIENAAGERIIDFKQHNLHVMGYAAPLDKVVSLQELKDYVYVEESQPDVIPYVTSYYKERSGFCMSKTQFDALPEGDYHLVIDSSFKDGSLTIADLVLPGKSREEIVLSSYICHPSMANNECAGPSLLCALILYLVGKKERHYTYRFVLGPETIGAIAYLSKHLSHLQKYMAAGFVLSCTGDDRAFSMVESKYADTLSDRVLDHVLSHRDNYTRYSFLERGSDERQYNAAGVNLPMVCFARSLFGKYPEYHTSADDLSLISPKGLQGSYDAMCEVLDILEYNRVYKMTVTCEPQLGRRGLYPTVSRKGSYDDVKVLTAFIAYADGTYDLLTIAEIIGVPAHTLIPMIDTLRAHDLLEVCA